MLAWLQSDSSWDLPLGRHANTASHTQAPAEIDEIKTLS